MIRIVDIEITSCLECPYHDPEDNVTFYCCDQQIDMFIKDIDKETNFPNNCKLEVY